MFISYLMNAKKWRSQRTNYTRGACHRSVFSLKPVLGGFAWLTGCARRCKPCQKGTVDWQQQYLPTTRCRPAERTLCLRQGKHVVIVTCTDTNQCKVRSNCCQWVVCKIFIPVTKLSSSLWTNVTCWRKMVVVATFFVTCLCFGSIHGKHLRLLVRFRRVPIDCH